MANNKLIDPHSVFKNSTNVDLSDLNFYAELSVTKRNRLGGNGNNDDIIKINFLGSNSDGVFTTDWTENNENFGIKSINFKMTSSYVPQVDIVFEDIRGQALMNDHIDSKYRVIFDMPPPIFNLTLKGYYGQSVSYKLHKLQHNIKFVNNNSFEISASFVGMTYAPLADMYVDYLSVAPYLTDENLIGNDTDTFLELKDKSRKLTSKIKSITEKDSKALEDKSQKINNLSIASKDYTKNLIASFTSIGKLEGGQNNEVITTVDPKNKSLLTVSLKRTNNIYTASSFADLSTLIREVKQFISDHQLTFKIYKDIAGSIDELPKGVKNGYIPVFKIDLSEANNKIRQRLNLYGTEISKQQEEVKNKVNKTVLSEVTPTLENVLGIILRDARRFYDKLKATVTTAQTSRAGNNDTSHGEAPKYAFPIYYKNNSQKTRSIPEDNSWEEVKFVDQYINAKLKAKDFDNKSIATNFSVENLDENKFVPINVFDSILVSDKTAYQDMGDVNTLVDIIIMRGLVLLNMSIPNSDSSSNLVKIYARLEAINILEVLKDKDKLLDAFLQLIKSDAYTFTDPKLALNTTIDQGKTNTITQASPEVTYQFTKNIEIRSADNFTKFGVPEVRADNNFPSSDIPAYGDNMIALNKAYSGSLCQYNVPLFVDSKFAEPFNNNSDYLSGSNNIFHFNKGELSAIKTTDAFLDELFINGGLLRGKIANPFTYPALKESGIHVLPRFVLVTWGYIMSKDNKGGDSQDAYNKIPANIKALFIDFYTKFSNKFASDYSQNNSEYMVKLILAENDSKRQDDFFESDFIKYFTEPFYLILADGETFNQNTRKTIFDRKSVNNNAYFKELKQSLLTIKNVVKNNIDTQKNFVNSKLQSNDMRSALYDSFKSFTDKWILDSDSISGDMFNIDNFLMIDRGFNNIGSKVMLDLSPLYDTTTTADTSVYTLLLNLLTKNNFEFFALPAYMNYNEASEGGKLWDAQTIFGTQQTVDTKASPKFICMYVGGTSSQVDMSKLGEGLSHEDDSADISEINDLSELTAFKVEFDTENQSFYYGLELDQIEFKETNESIVVLDRIASSDQNLTETAGNSLFNVYEQRSYTATFTMLGNVMIQPTMYFNLTNIAMFKGTYLVLEVNHNIVDNKVTTVFKGVRIPKIAKPYVTDYTMLANVSLGNNLGYGDYTAVNSAGGINTGKVTKSIDFIGRINTAGLSDKEKAILDVIAFSEGTLVVKSTNGYDVLNGGGLIPTWKKDYKMGHGRWAAAAGRYQFQFGTWVNGTNNPAFNEANQDTKAIAIVREQFKKYKLDLENVDEASFRKYLDSIATTWAALPYYKSFGLNPKYSWSAGQSFYAKSGTDKSQGGITNGNTLAKLWSVFNQALGYYKNGIIFQGLNRNQEYYVNMLRPEVQPKFVELITKIQNETGWSVNITSSYRGIEKQKAIKEGDDRNATAGLSPHNYGLAIDLNLVKGNQTILKNADKSIWEATGAIKIARDLKFVWGGDFATYSDTVHFEATNNGTRYSTGVLLAKAKLIYGDINNINFDGRKVSLA